jgi:excisionase family DNA binding protein
MAGQGMFTVREVAGRLRVSTATVYRMCERGELGHVRVSNAIRVPEVAVAALIKRALGCLSPVLPMTHGCLPVRGHGQTGEK